MEKTLKQDFEARKQFYANRASAVFPIHFLGSDNDLIISFLNYWDIKNGLPSDSIIINVRVYDNEGVLCKRALIDKLDDNNIISLREYVKDAEFYGMVEVEAISSSNIAFTFPALIGIYRSGSYYSCVHSAGRIKGADESHNSSVTIESNWSCKFQQGIKPFFHYVNGNKTEDVELVVYLYDGSGTQLSKAKIAEKYNPFASKIYFINDIFTDITFSESMFVGVECLNDNVFRRMVVGNFHSSINHFEVTHSYPVQKNIDLCPKVDAGCESYLACYSAMPLT